MLDVVVDINVNVELFSSIVLVGKYHLGAKFLSSGTMMREVGAVLKKKKCESSIRQCL